MEKHFSSDKPVTDKQEDKFQRAGFAKRIAQTIIDRENSEGIVIGIYGVWGEGKTSVLNFIEEELKNSESVISIKFNPWRYTDENAVLTHFFQVLASSLNAKLKTQNEKIGEIFQKYGKLLNFEIPLVGINVGETIEGAGDILADVDIEALKKRIENILQENKKKVVVFIDDIDRLDKNEVHAVFRLVKLTADFAYTTYILSFDERMVSSAIADRFGEGNIQAGQNFLEKIIQVPLKIPVAQPEALKNFCFELINNAFSSNNIEVNENEVRRFVGEFSNNILCKLDTPRLAVRFGNTLSFSLPLLYGEVNTVDLMLIEAIKIFYPQHYEFIKSHPEYFIGSYSNTYSNGKDEDKKKEIKNHFEELGKNLNKKQQSSIKDLLTELFPRLNEAFANYVYQANNLNDWYRNKRISSPQYFNRYFSYAVIKGDLSDIVFANFLQEISSQTVEETATSIKELITQSSPDNFLHKIRILEEELDWHTSTQLAKAICISSDNFPKGSRFSFFGFDTPNGQAAIFIHKLIKKHKNKEEQLNLSKELLKIAQPFEFAYELVSWFTRGEPGEKLFDDDGDKELAQLMIDRVLEQANSNSLFEKYEIEADYLLSSWSLINNTAVNKYLRGYLDLEPNKVINLIRSFTPTGWSSAKPEPFKVDFAKEQYDRLISIIDKHYINELISKAYSEEEINHQPPIITHRTEENQSDLNMIRQFRKLFSEDTEFKQEETQPKLSDTQPQDT